jgi:hypothetical protein
VRLAWWRERLEDLDRGASTPPEPRLRAVASELLARGVTGGELSALEDAWLPQLEPFPWGLEQAAGFRLRGRIIFGIGARLLDGRPIDAEPAGEIWSLIDAAHHCSDARSRECLLSEAARLNVSSLIPTKLRPLTTLCALAIIDTRGSSPFRRGIAAIAHRVTGRIPDPRDK